MLETTRCIISTASLPCSSYRTKNSEMCAFHKKYADQKPVTSQYPPSHVIRCRMTSSQGRCESKVQPNTDFCSFHSDNAIIVVNKTMHTKMREIIAVITTCNVASNSRSLNAECYDEIDKLLALTNTITEKMIKKRKNEQTIAASYTKRTCTAEDADKIQQESSPM